MWFNESVFYQIYTLNFCGAPRDNDGIVEHRILRLNDFMDIVSPDSGKIEGDGKPDTEINKDIAINWEEVRSDLEEQYLEPYGPFADYVMDLNVVYDDASGMLTVLLPVTKKTTSDVAVVYAQDVLGTIGEAVSTQNFYFTAPEENEDGYTTDYGSFFDEHDVKVQVFPYDKEGDESAYLVNDTIKAGDVRAVEPLQ